MTDDWVPFGLTDDELVSYQVLVDGVPAWMKERLVAWLCQRLTSDGWANASSMIVVQNESRVELQFFAGQGSLRSSALADRLRSKAPLDLLRLTDYVLSKSYRSNPGLKALEELLKASKSKWCVGMRVEGRFGLVERVPEGVQSFVEGTIANSAAAGKVLARAWSHIYGLQPNDSGGYADAVRAVEISAIGVVMPNHGTATLGTVLGQMKADGDWRLDLREHPDAPGPEMVLAMGRTLWFGHRDRHGSVNYSDVSHDEARQAVALAATLVDWFSSGALKRRSASSP